MLVSPFIADDVLVFCKVSFYFNFFSFSISFIHTQHTYTCTKIQVKLNET